MMKRIIKKVLDFIPVYRNMFWGNYLYQSYSRVNRDEKKAFLIKNVGKFYWGKCTKCKGVQIKNLLQEVDIVSQNGGMFFYSIDCFKSIKSENQVLVNYTIDYSLFLRLGLQDIVSHVAKSSDLKKNIDELYGGIEQYFNRVKSVSSKIGISQESINSMEGFFVKPAESLFDGFQRILFVNQLLWQTGHKHNGFGRLDLILNDLYRSDIEKGIMTREKVSRMVNEFLRVLHNNYWYKSGMLMGDTGQIIIIGGLDSTGNYFSNELSKIFIEETMKLRLTEPKVFLRCSKNMPDDLLTLAVDSIATGIGSPFLSNDDVVVPGLIDYGYDKEDAYNHCASACWEPLIINSSADLNNIRAFNFAIPFDRMLKDKACEGAAYEELLSLYETYLKEYTKEILTPLERLIFEEDPLLSLANIEVLKGGKDITRGGAKYNNLGLTSVGMACVVDSLINVKELVFDKSEYSMSELVRIRNSNYAENETLQKICKENCNGYGTDSKVAVELSNRFMKVVSKELMNYHTINGGGFKIGFSSPFYITEAGNVGATFDGRLDGEPFTVHISSNKSVTPLELFKFASKLDYNQNVINGNVVDFVMSPTIIKSNPSKFVFLIKKAFEMGVYQMQLNVIDSKTLIEAKKNPHLYEYLIVRVWGFSAYFNDLPDEYKDLLIRRVIESEVA